jgi:hypothetical protein
MNDLIIINSYTPDYEREELTYMKRLITLFLIKKMKF